MKSLCKNPLLAGIVVGLVIGTVLGILLTHTPVAQAWESVKTGYTDPAHGVVCYTYGDRAISCVKVK